MRDKCCANCRYNRRLVKYDYSHGGCKHTDMEGFACVMPENQGDVVWMYGDAQEIGQCECWARKEGAKE